MRGGVNGSWAIAIFLNEATMILGIRSCMDCTPALFAVVTEAVDMTTEVWSIASTAVESMAFITHLIIQNIWLYLHLLVNVSISDLKKAA